jgi:hypothetical protein
MLKMVLMPSSRRTGATFFMAGWWLGANMNPRPVCSMLCGNAAPALRLMLTPRLSSTSALPLLLLTLRPPCLLTRAPAAAATNMAQVEMLKVCEPSPPVPTMSTRWLVSATVHLGRKLAHDLRGRRDFTDGFFFDPQTGDECGHHDRRHLSAHDEAHEVQHFVVKNFAMLDGALQRLLGGDFGGVGHGGLRKSPK